MLKRKSVAYKDITAIVMGLLENGLPIIQEILRSLGLKLESIAAQDMVCAIR
jgi:hypothetical protein